MVVCLDQCACSAIFIPKKPNPKARSLGEFLIEQAKQGSIVCPIPHEANAETLALPMEKRLELQKGLSLLAENKGGRGLLAFKNLWQIIAEESLALARSESPPLPYELFEWRNMDDNVLAERISADYKSARKQWKHNVECMGLKTHAKRSIKEIRASVITEHASHVFRQITRVIEDQPLCPNDSMAIGLLDRLRAMGITKNELLALRSAVINHRWERIPVVAYRTILAAQLEAEYSAGKRIYDPNDEFDVSRLAVGLYAAEVVVTEKFMTNICRQARTKNVSSAKVFAIRDAPSVIEFISANRFG